MRNKFGNIKSSFGGIKFDSRKEMQRYFELQMLERGGVITNLTRQKPFELVPAQYINGKCVERGVKYICDFYYYDKERNEWVCEDVKSEITRKNKDYIIKRKLMLWLNDIRIKEV